jgi:hypothetical protein
LSIPNDISYLNGTGGPGSSCAPVAGSTSTITTYYSATTASPGVSVGDIVAQTQIIDNTTGAILSTFWYDTTKGTVLNPPPPAASLSVLASTPLTNAELRATPVNVNVVNGGSQLQFVVSSYKAIAAGAGYSVGDLIDQIDEYNVTTNPATYVATTWRNITTDATIATPVAADIIPLSSVASSVTILPGTNAIGSVIVSNPITNYALETGGNLAAIAAVEGTVADAAWTGTGSGTNNAILKAIDLGIAALASSGSATAANQVLQITQETTANTNLVKIDTDLLAFAAANHTDLVQIDTDIKALLAADAGLATAANQVLQITQETTANTNLVKIDTDLLAFAAANHVDLTALATALATLDTDLKAFQAANHTDLAAILTELGVIDTDIKAVTTAVNTVDTDLKAFAAANHTDLTALATLLTTINTELVTIDTDIKAVTTAVNTFAAANHTDLTLIDTDLKAFAAANHIDLTLIDTDLKAFAAANHTDLTLIDTDLKAFAAANHTDLTTLDTDVKAITTALNTDLGTPTTSVAGDKSVIGELLTIAANTAAPTYTPTAGNGTAASFPTAAFKSIEIISTDGQGVTLVTSAGTNLWPALSSGGVAVPWAATVQWDANVTITSVTTTGTAANVYINIAGE